MGLYLIIATFYLICIPIEIKSKILSKSKVWISLLLIPLCVLTAFRGLEIGNDTLVYYNIFNKISQESLFEATISRLEPGYVFFMRLFGQFDLSYFVFQIAIALFIYYMLGKFIKEYSCNISLSIFVFITMRFMFGAMNLTRQFIAIGILLFSLNYIRVKSFFKFCVVVMVASLFHSSALVFLLMYPLSNIKLSLKRILSILLVSIILMLTFDKMISLAFLFIGKYEGYLQTEYFQMEDNIAVYFQMLMYLVIFILGVIDKHYIFKQCKTKENIISIDRVLISGAILTLFFGIIGLKTAIMDRLVLYFSVMYIAYIPNAIKSIKNKYVAFICMYLLVLILYLSFVIIMKFRPNWNNTIPYDWFWN